MGTILMCPRICHPTDFSSGFDGERRDIDSCFWHLYVSADFSWNKVSSRAFDAVTASHCEGSLYHVLSRETPSMKNLDKAFSLSLSLSKPTYLPFQHSTLYYVVL